MSKLYKIYKTHLGRDSIIARNLTEDEAHEALMEILDDIDNIRYFDEDNISSYDGDQSFFDEDGYYSFANREWCLIYRPFIDLTITYGLPHGDWYGIEPHKASKSRCPSMSTSYSPEKMLSDALKAKGASNEEIQYMLNETKDNSIKEENDKNLQDKLLGCGIIVTIMILAGIIIGGWAVIVVGAIILLLSATKKK